MINSFDQLDLSKKYTYADYLNWHFDDPSDQTLLVYILVADEYQLYQQKPFTKGEKVPIGIDESLLMNLDDIFE